ncbi:8970_t:CDS:2 [Ambispora gerdemannii]|uniref:8970_t:CDS:1 n=1 Tax=Ambispora gerdemannii TaxID=144530 RepID=A0A9N8W5J6_9GLOM|nr:8970_t:CDS:2 [Ambispora gerdemannii]
MKRIASRAWNWLNRPSWNYHPLSTKVSPPFISICGLKLAKTPKRLTILLVSLILIIILAYFLPRSSETEYARIFDGNGTCELPPWKNITQDHTVIDITPGRTFVSIQHDPLTGDQLINVNCKTPFEYHFPSMHSIFNSKFKSWDQSTEGQLKFEEEYVMIKCENESNFLTREPMIKEQQNSNSPLPDHSILNSQSPLVDDVVFLLLDAVSREHFNEEFPKTVDLLKNMQQHTNNKHETFSFNRYNVLGTNSPPNKAFLYSGQSKDYLSSKRGDAEATWLWELYEDQGFVTMHSDGECGGWWEWPYTGYADGSITYHYQKVRDDDLPAQHQFPHVSMCDTYRLFKDEEFERTCKLQHGMDSQYDSLSIDGMIVPSRFCMGQKAIYEAQFDYLRQFLDVYRGLDENGEHYKRFATVTLMDTHSPEMKIKSLDDSMVNLFTELLIGDDKSGEKPLLHPNSVVVILSDHGIHYGSEAASYEGHFHHKQPPLHMILPKNLADQHRPGFLINKDKLTTHMDLHMTLLYLAFGQSENMSTLSTAAALKDPSNFFQGGENEKTSAQKYGEVLLLPINVTRTCQSVAIPPEFCPCVKFTPLNNNLTDDAIIIRKFLELAVDSMNTHIDTLGVGKVCQKFDFHPTTANLSATGEFEYGDVAFYSGYYLPASKKESQVYSVVANIKTFLAKVKFTATYGDIMNGRKNKVDVVQITSYKDEWEGICRGRIRDNVEDGDNKVANGEFLLKNFCFCSKNF